MLPTVFIGSALGRVETLLGEVERVEKDGVVVAESGEFIPCDIILKNFGFEPPDAHLGGIVGKTNIRSPIWISRRTLLFKAEHNMSLGPQGKNPVPEGHAIAIPASVVFMVDAYLELYLHFRERPEDLDALLADGDAVPDVSIWEDTHSSLSKGWWSAMKTDAGLEGRIQKLRSDFNKRTQSRYTVQEFVQQNKDDWEEACEQLTGDPAAVPYVWESIYQGLLKAPHMFDAVVNRQVEEQARL